MDEFWVCQHCRSLNRAASGRCYSCRNKFGSKPKDKPEIVREEFPAPSPPTFQAPPPPPGPGAAAAQALSSMPPAYLSRPSAGVPVTGARSFTTAAQNRERVRNPITRVKRRIAASLALRQSVSVAPLGYAIAGLLVVFSVALAALVLNLMPATAYLLQHGNVEMAWSQLAAGQQSSVRTLLLASAGLGLLLLVLFSTFVGLSTHNAPGLGADVPMLSPYGAGTCWWEVVWVQIRAAFVLLASAALVYEGWALPGLIIAALGLEVVQDNVDDLEDWLTRPSRHLPDLYAKLGVQGSMGSGIAGIWSICFRAANILGIAVCAIPAAGVAATAAMQATGRHVVLWQSIGLGPVQIAVAALLGAFAVATAATIVLAVPVSVGLVGRQRVRKTLVRVGRSRSWLARPGEGVYANAPGAGGIAAPAAPYDSFQDADDRVIERYPGGIVPPEYGLPDDDRSGQGFSTILQRGRPAPYGAPPPAGSPYGAPPPANPAFGPASQFGTPPAATPFGAPPAGVGAPNGGPRPPEPMLYPPPFRGQNRTPPMPPMPPNALPPGFLASPALGRPGPAPFGHDPYAPGDQGMPAGGPVRTDPFAPPDRRLPAAPPFGAPDGPAAPQAQSFGRSQPPSFGRPQARPPEPSNGAVGSNFDEGLSRPDAGGGLGAPRYGAPPFPGRDQASLNSPSTTSSPSPDDDSPSDSGA